MKKFYSLLLMIVLSIGAKQVQAQICTANFSFNQGINGLVNFTDLSIGTNSNTSWMWDFGEPQSGNNNYSWLQSPSHTYQSNGVYTVTLAINDWTLGGCASTVVMNVTVTSSPCNLPLYANFTSTNGMGGSFSVTSITTGTTGAATYSYSWGDGGSALGANASHTYLANGNYFVTLFVTDGVCTDSADMQINISTVGCSLVPSYISQNQLNGTVDFTSTSTGTVPGMYYYWLFGDGAGMGTNTYSITHNYLNNGTYTVSMYASTPGSCSAVYLSTVSITNGTCNLYASFTSTNNLNNYTVTSTSTGTNMGTTYFWNFGDGATANTPGAQHSYTSNGVYTIYFIASNSGNCTDSVSQQVTVNNLCNVAPSFSVMWGGGANPTYNFVAAQQNNSLQVNYTWNYGDGNTDNGPWVSHQYSVTGTYSVVLTVTDPNVFPACTATALAVVNVTCAVIGSFTQTVMPAGLVNFTATSTGTTLGTTYNWMYGDGTTGTGITSSHTYSNGGVHVVSLITNNSPSCYDSISNWVNVNTLPCIANSNFSVIYSGTPLYWNAVPVYFGNVYAANWTWGDGTSAYALYPSHTYSAAGLYNVCVTVSTSCGTSTTCANYNIYKTSGPVNVDQQMVHLNVIQNSPTALKKLMIENAVVKIYPIPSNGKVELRVSDLLSSSRPASAEVIDMLGREVYREEIQVTNGKIDADLDLQHLNNGTYFIKVRSTERTYTSRIIISH